MKSVVRKLDLPLLDRLSIGAAAHARRRLNHNLHESMQDQVQRLCNAFEPGTYVPVHRHTSKTGFELFAALRGRVVLLVFDDDGVVLERVEVGHDGPVPAAEIPAGNWHGLAALEPGTVMLEIKAGPYQPGQGVECASWSPPEGDARCAAIEAWYRCAAVGERIPR